MTEQVKYVIKNLKTGEYVREVHLSTGEEKGNRLSVGLTKDRDKALKIKSVPYEPNHTRIAECLTAWTDAIYQAKLRTDT